MTGRNNENNLLKHYIRGILVPLDLSFNSDKAYKYAYRMAFDYNACLHVVNVIAISFSGYINSFRTTAGISHQFIGSNLINDRMKKIESVIDRYSDRKTRLVIEKDVRIGDPASEIIKYSMEKGINLIIMGTHGRSGLSGILLGSVAEKVIRKAHCPVLVVRPRTVDSKIKESREDFIKV